MTKRKSTKLSEAEMWDLEGVPDRDAFMGTTTIYLVRNISLNLCWRAAVQRLERTANGMFARADLFRSFPKTHCMTRQ